MVYPSYRQMGEAYVHYYKDENNELDIETFLVRWACDWQRDQDAMKCDAIQEANHENGAWSRASGAEDCAKAIREAGNDTTGN